MRHRNKKASLCFLSQGRCVVYWELFEVWHVGIFLFVIKLFEIYVADMTKEVYTIISLGDRFEWRMRI